MEKLNTTPYDVFRCFVSDEVIALIVTETNKYAAEVIANATVTRKSRLFYWKPTDITEMKKFIGLLLFMGVDKKTWIPLYWSHGKPT